MHISQNLIRVNFDAFLLHPFPQLLKIGSKRLFLDGWLFLRDHARSS
jgi:hypothetical protein